MTTPAPATLNKAANDHQEIRTFARRAIARRGPLWMVENLSAAVSLAVFTVAPPSADVTADEIDHLIDVAITVMREEVESTFHHLGLPVPELASSHGRVRLARTCAASARTPHHPPRRRQ